MIVILPMLVLIVLAAVLVGRAPWNRAVPDMAWVDHPGLTATPVVAHVPATPTRAALALARVEARGWLSSTAFAGAIALCLLEVVVFGFVWAADTNSWENFVVAYPVLVHPAVGLIVVAAHFATTRSRRDRSEEIFAACPADEATRTAGHLFSSWVPLALLAAFVVAITVVEGLRARHQYGGSWPLVGDALAAVVLGACGAALGVALARWARWPLVPVVFVALLLPVIAEVGNLGEPHWSNLRQLSTWPRYPNHDLLFADRHVWSHVAWLVLLGALMAVVALLHARRDRRMLIAAGVVSLAALLIGVVMTRPISTSSAERIASLVADPAAHQSCVTRGPVSVCAYRGYEKYARHVADELRPVGRAIATLEADPRPVVLRQHFTGQLATLGPEVARALRGRPVARPDVPLGRENGGASMGRARLVTAALVFGLPTTAARGLPHVVAGQARGVAALWLAAQGLPPHEQTEFATFHLSWQQQHGEHAELTEFDYGRAWPDTCDGGPPALVWSEPDLLAARLLLGRPVATVRAALVAHLAEIRNPATTTNQLLAMVGLGPVPAAPHITPRAAEC